MIYISQSKEYNARDQAENMGLEDLDRTTSKLPAYWLWSFSDENNFSYFSLYLIRNAYYKVFFNSEF
jgi:hypothetical protein